MIRALLKREMQLALRTGGGAVLALGFFLMVALLVPFAVGPYPQILAAVAPGIVWIAALLACLLSLDRLFHADFEDGTLEQLLLSPLPASAIVALKAGAHWMTTGLPILLLSPLLALMLSMPGQGVGVLLLSLLIGTPSLSFIGAIGAALSAGVKRGGLLLSLLTLPLYVPTLIFGARAVSNAVQGLNPQTPLLLLTAITFGVLALAPPVAAAALRIHLR